MSQLLLLTMATTTNNTTTNNTTTDRTTAVTVIFGVVDVVRISVAISFVYAV